MELHRKIGSSVTLVCNQNSGGLCQPRKPLLRQEEWTRFDFLLFCNIGKNSNVGFLVLLPSTSEGCEYFVGRHMYRMLWPSFGLRNPRILFNISSQSQTKLECFLVNWRLMGSPRSMDMITWILCIVLECPCNTQCSFSPVLCFLVYAACFFLAKFLQIPWKANSIMTALQIFLN